jgi:IS6 family transposase
MSDPSLFTWRHFEADIILCAVRWYLRYALSDRDVEELLRERGVWVDHTTVFRWVQCYAPELDQRCRPQLKAANDSYRVDETYIKIKKQWSYLNRAVDSTGATLDFMLSATRDAGAAEQCFRKVLDAGHTTPPRVITVDKNAAYPPAFEALQYDNSLPEACRLRQCKYLNNMMEQDHRLMKRRVNPGLGFGAFATAQRTIQGYEAMHMFRKGQLEGVAKGDILAQKRVINQLFGLAASRELTTRFSHAHEFLQHNPYVRVWQMRRTALGLQGRPKVDILQLQGLGEQAMLQRPLDGALDILPHGAEPDGIGIFPQHSRLFLEVFTREVQVR